ncbi:MAG: phenylalanine--tRNA ligase subunit beta, partial [bacterium]|nr:phenylalanine--tRNA ligase subunit beta [bacterium]
MKFSYNWISELVDGVDVGPADLSHLITTRTAECEDVVEVGSHLAAVCAARVTSVEQIPDSKNKKVAVDTGRYGAKTVVCGAPNCRVGMTTAYVPAGVTLGEREIRKVEIGGVTSDGMLASGAELEINRDTEGILEFEAEPGEAIPGCGPDHIIEVDNKAITHRPDLWGHHGLAREVAAILRKPLRNPVTLALLPGGAGDINVAIADYDLCQRYSGLTFDNVHIGPSPLWLQYRLQTIDIHPISNIVDVTNFVMAEIAEPMHAFDRDTLNGNTIFVRTATEGESIVALNGEHYDLDPTITVIADAKGPVAIGGVIGGMDTGIVDATTRMVLEAANFKASSIRKTSSKLKLRTDASMRFEKAQDPANTVRGLARAIE